MLQVMSLNHRLLLLLLLKLLLVLLLFAFLLDLWLRMFELSGFTQNRKQNRFRENDVAWRSIFAH